MNSALNPCKRRSDDLGGVSQTTTTTRNDMKTMIQLLVVSATLGTSTAFACDSCAAHKDKAVKKECASKCKKSCADKKACADKKECSEKKECSGKKKAE